MKCRGTWVVLSAVAWAAAAPALAKQPGSLPRAWLGTWLIAEGQPAPWIARSDNAAIGPNDGILGRTVTFTPTRIVAPHPLSCRKADYSLHDAPPEALFQGGLTQPAVQASALGFRGRTSPRLASNCGSMFEYHLTDGGTLLFALDNTIYTLRRR